MLLSSTFCDLVAVMNSGGAGTKEARAVSLSLGLWCAQHGADIRVEMLPLLPWQLEYDPEAWGNLTVSSMSALWKD